MVDRQINLPLTETLTPADEAAVVEAVRSAARGGTPVYPVGGATLMYCGQWPTRPGIGLSLAGLNRIVDHQADDMTITVEAGVTVAQLSQCLAERRQRLPVDVAAAERATIGGVLAADPSGPRRYACGTIRDYVLGLRAVDGQGMAFGAGGRVVKNAAGYNLPRLLVGSLGTLAVITQVTLMVRPVPETSAFVACDLPDFETAERLLAALVRTQTLPTAIELLCSRTVGQVANLPELRQVGNLPHEHAARLLVGFEGSAAEVEWMVGQLQGEWRALGVDAAHVANGFDAERLWSWLVETPADQEITVRPSQTVALIAEIRRTQPDVTIHAHAGDGVIRLCGTNTPCATAVSAVQAVPPDTARLTQPWHTTNGAQHRQDACATSAAAVVRAIKQRFDPQGILNPGRIVF